MNLEQRLANIIHSPKIDETCRSEVNLSNNTPIIYPSINIQKLMGYLEIVSPSNVLNILLLFHRDTIKSIEIIKECWIFDNTIKLWTIRNKYGVYAFITTAFDEIHKYINIQFPKLADKLLINLTKMKQCIHNHNYLPFAMILHYFNDWHFIHKLNTNKTLLPIRNNRVVDLTTGLVRDRMEMDHFSIEYPVTWSDTDEYLPLVYTYMDNILLGNRSHIQFVQQLLGYCITGYNMYDVVFFLRQAPVLITLLQQILGPFYYQIDRDILTDDPVSKDKLNLHLFKLRWARIINCIDIEEDDYIINIAEIKTVTDISKLYNDKLQLKSLGKIFISSEHLPTQNNISEIVANSIVIPMGKYTDSRNKQLSFTFFSDEFKSAFFKWMVMGAKLWIQHKQLNIPTSINEFTDKIADPTTDTMDLIISLSKIHRSAINNRKKDKTPINFDVKKIVKNEDVNNDGVNNDGVNNDGVNNDGVNNDGVKNDGVKNDGVKEVIKKEVIKKEVIKKEVVKIKKVVEKKCFTTEPSVNVFIEEKCDIVNDLDKIVRSTILYNAYKDWCKLNNVYYLTHIIFSKIISKKIGKIHRNTGSHFRGISLID